MALIAPNSVIFSAQEEKHLELWSSGSEGWIEGILWTLNNH